MQNFRLNEPVILHQSRGEGKIGDSAREKSSAGDVLYTQNRRRFFGMAAGPKKMPQQ